MPRALTWRSCLTELSQIPISENTRLMSLALTWRSCRTAHSQLSYIRDAHLMLIAVTWRPCLTERSRLSYIRKHTFGASCSHLKALPHRTFSSLLDQNSHCWCLLLSLQGLVSQSFLKSPISELTLVVPLALIWRPCLTGHFQVSYVRKHAFDSSRFHLKALPQRAFSSLRYRKTYVWCLLLSLEGLVSQSLLKFPISENTLLMTLALTWRHCLTKLVFQLS